MTTSGALVADLAGAGELLAVRKYDEAEAEILRVLSGNPTDPKALNLLALVRYKLGRLEDALVTYRQISIASPQDAGARRNLGLLALKLGRLEEAVPDLEMAVRIAPTDERAWSYLGYAYAKRGEAVEAAAAFRRAGQDALANDLEQTAKVQRPVARAFARPIALAPPLPPPPPSGEARVESAARPMPPAGAGAGAVAAGPSPPREAQPISLLSFVLSRLGQSAASLPGPSGALRLVVADEIHARADVLLAGAGALRWEPAFRRAQGRRTSEPLGGAPGRHFRLSGAGEVWIAGAPGRWWPLRLADDVLYVREDRVLAFEGSLTWESGMVPNARLQMLQFRGRGTVVLALDDPPIAFKVTDDKPTLLGSSRLLGWVGRLVPHGAPLPEASPFQLGCQGEGVVLIDGTPASFVGDARAR